MQILIFRATTVALFLAPIFTSCAALQEAMPDDQPIDGPPRSFDYIDDRIPDEPEVVNLNADDWGPEELEHHAPIRQLSLQVGDRDFTDDVNIGRLNSEIALGIEYAHEVRNGLGFEVGALGSRRNENGLSGNPDITGTAAEVYGGARYWFKGERSWMPYVGGGLSAIRADVDDGQGGQDSDDEDFSLGIYAHCGIEINVTEIFFVGADARALFATDIDLDSVSGDADYLQFMLVLGFRL